ncbi:hypothetical protein LDENG_00010240 [Lucifuga dentata]|nr:hypothetical protein LDENG_00010240 [Lucifuga dentata]
MKFYWPLSSSKLRRPLIGFVRLKPLLLFSSALFCSRVHMIYERYSEMKITESRYDVPHWSHLKDHTTHYACLSLIYSVFIHVTLLTIISQRIKPYFSFPDILLNLLIFQNQIFK